VILGWDVSGTVTATGSGVHTFKTGDEVFGMVNFPGHGKAYAEYVAAPATQLALKPPNVSHAEAAAATLAALTAWQVLVQQANIQRNQHVLIHAAAGGVGHFAVQIAKHFGATVTGTASAANRDFLQSLGIDHFIDYTNSDFTDVAKEMDIVLDPIGGETTVKSLQVVKKGGTLVSIVGGAKENVQHIATGKGITAKNYLVHSSGEDMRQLAALLEQGILRPVISQLYSFLHIADAHKQIETGRTRGKIVVQVA
jgi:NADPH:quinone reductase-like Zn-dependent oxidoreductase